MPPSPSQNPSGDDADANRPRVTPGLIVSILAPHRLADVAGHLNLPVPALAALTGPDLQDSVAQRMLSQLTDAELRALAKALGVPTDGQFIDLYRRLHRLC